MDTFSNVSNASKLKSHGKLVMFASIACAVILAIGMLSGCTGNEKEQFVGDWHFGNIEIADAASTAPAAESSDSSAATSENADTSADAQAPAANVEEQKSTANMLSVFMYDTQITFSNDGKVVINFMGQEYNGTFEVEKGVAHVTMDPDISSFEMSGDYAINGDTLVFTPSDPNTRLGQFKVTYLRGAYEQQAPDAATSTAEGTSSAASESATESSDESTSVANGVAAGISEKAADIEAKAEKSLDDGAKAVVDKTSGDKAAEKAETADAQASDSSSEAGK